MSSYDTQRVDRAFEATTPRRSRGGMLLVLLGLAAGFYFVLPQARAALGGAFSGFEYLIPWLLLLALLGAGWMAARRMRDVRQALASAWAHVQLEEWDALRNALDTLLSRPIRGNSERGQALFMLGALLEHDGRHELAARVYERMLIERIGDAWHLQNAQLSMAYCKVRAHELTDAVQMIERLSQLAMPDSLRARYEWIRLFQRVFMGHYEDAIERLEERVELFRRYLSTRAGFAYALLAAALHRLDRRDEASDWWGRATALVPADRLMNDYEMCREAGVTYPAVEHCL